jgi:ABC-type bacteriocin/lantibiotic exporter with double-glycine peptidase domain
VLDEATSALDEESEAAVFDALGDWLAGRTVLAIAHRLTTVSRFPRAIVLEGGRVSAEGPPPAVPGPAGRLAAASGVDLPESA